MWTRFMDMHSGGSMKLDWPYIYIEAPEKEAKLIFYNMFNRHPDDVACNCCGSNYSVSESVDLQQATAHDRSCKFVSRKKEEGGGHYIEEADTKYGGKFIPLEEFLKSHATNAVLDSEGETSVKVVFAKDILPSHRAGYLPDADEGYNDGDEDY